QAGTIKTYLSIELRPRPDKYYLIELIDDPRGRREMTTEITRSTDPSQPMLVRTDQVALSDAFRVTFQFAKRIKFATFRFGIKESTGGVGLDLAFLNKDLQLWTDAFDFQANVFPRLKMLVAWRFFSRLYIVGGIDDALNERPRDGVGGGRDFFLGASLRFDDRDLRTMLLVGGGAVGGMGK
ncbi:MAG: MCE family protein, partial [Deltaproteobacteria bacterium]|nr:MCE family protein [Deltaproteobacteria bacterium]